MSDTVTCDACDQTSRSSRKTWLQVVLPEPEETKKSERLLGVWRPRWDACSTACAHALVDRYEARGGA